MKELRAALYLLCASSLSVLPAETDRGEGTKKDELAPAPSSEPLSPVQSRALELRSSVNVIDTQPHNQQNLAIQASAQLVPVGSHNISGTLLIEAILDEKEASILSQEIRPTGGIGTNKMYITGDFEGLPPHGQHALQILDAGDCLSSKSVFNPAGFLYGGPNQPIRPAGVLGNLDADGNGKAHIKHLDTVIMLNGPQSVIGKAVVIRERPDNFKTSPDGNAGAILACGIIKLTEELNIKEIEQKEKKGPAIPPLSEMLKKVDKEKKNIPSSTSFPDTAPALPDESGEVHFSPFQDSLRTDPTKGLNPKKNG